MCSQASAERIAGVDPGGVERHEHHRRRVGVAGVEVGAAVGIVLDEQEVPAAVAVLGGDEPMDGGGGHGLTGGDQALDGERLGEGLAVAVDAGGGVVQAVEEGEQVWPPNAAGLRPAATTAWMSSPQPPAVAQAAAAWAAR